MKITNCTILLTIIILSLISLPLILFTAGPWRMILGFLLLLFFPGYSLISALFPSKGKLNSIEGLALSFGLSCAVVVIMGFILNYTPWGIKLNAFIISITCFIVLMAAIGWYRQQKLSPSERFSITLPNHPIK